MAAVAVAGKSGKVQITGTPVWTVALIDNWTGTLTTAQYDQTSLGDQWTSDVTGLQTLTGTLAGKWAVTSEAGQTALHNAALSAITVGLYLSTNGTDGYDLTAHIDSFQSTVPVGGLVTFSANFRSTGQVFFN